MLTCCLSHLHDSQAGKLYLVEKYCPVNNTSLLSPEMFYRILERRLESGDYKVMYDLIMLWPLCYSWEKLVRSLVGAEPGSCCATGACLRRARGLLGPRRACGSCLARGCNDAGEGRRDASVGREIDGNPVRGFGVRSSAFDKRLRSGSRWARTPSGHWCRRSACVKDLPRRIHRCSCRFSARPPRCPTFPTRV